MNNQKGQLILTLILVMATALVIGLSVIQRSLTDVSTSTKVEQSSRAFSAAEAGIEQYLGSNVNCRPDTCKVEFSDIGSEATVEGGDLIPCIPGLPGCEQPANTRQDPLEFPLLSKEEVAQVWLADPISESNPPAVFYNPPPVNRTLDIFWGNSSENKAALEATLVYYEANQYKSKKWYLDHISSGRNNNFEPVSSCSSGGQKPITSEEYKLKYGDNSYQCKYILTGLPANLMLLRIRLLYNDAKSQPFAAQATGICDSCFLPRQAKVLTSKGSSGETQRKVQLFQSIKVVPPYLNYAIFSAGEITK